MILLNLKIGTNYLITFHGGNQMIGTLKLLSTLVVKFIHFGSISVANLFTSITVVLKVLRSTMERFNPLHILLNEELLR